ncbi:hypothetical protein D3C73_1403820 [compost metagenome]
MAGDIHCPGLFDEAPARICFKNKVSVLQALTQIVEIIRHPDAFMRFTLINKKAFFNFALIHIMKGINHVIKPLPDRDGGEFITRDLAVIKLRTGGNKLAAA